MRRRRVATITAPRKRPDVGYDPALLADAASRVRGGLGELGLELEPSLSMRLRKWWRGQDG